MRKSCQTYSAAPVSTHASASAYPHLTGLPARSVVHGDVLVVAQLRVVDARQLERAFHVRLAGHVVRDQQQPLAALRLQLLVITARVGEDDGAGTPFAEDPLAFRHDLAQLLVVGAGLLVALRQLASRTVRMRAR